MTYEYIYTGDLPTVFLTLQKNNQTWKPVKGDKIKSPKPINHPLLQLVEKEAPQAPALEEPIKEPVAVSEKESPVLTADETKES